MSNSDANRRDAYHEAIRVALISEWDPIGVNEFPEAQDEYDSYVPNLVDMLFAQKSKYDIFDYLWRMETRHMGLSGNLVATSRFANRIMEIQQEVDLAQMNFIPKNPLP